MKSTPAWIFETWQSAGIGLWNAFKSYWVFLLPSLLLVNFIKEPTIQYWWSGFFFASFVLFIRRAIAERPNRGGGE